MLPKLSASAHALLLSALVGATAVALPAAARAQSIAPERALLNHAQTGVLFAVSDDPVMFADAPGVDGVRALLNRASS